MIKLKEKIIYYLNETTNENYYIRKGIITGLEIAMYTIFEIDTDKDEEIQAAYKRLYKRLF